MTGYRRLKPLLLRLQRVERANSLRARPVVGRRRPQAIDSSTRPTAIEGQVATDCGQLTNELRESGAAKTQTFAPGRTAMCSVCLCHQDRGLALQDFQHRHGRGRVAPLAADVGQYGGDVGVAHAVAQGRHAVWAWIAGSGRRESATAYDLDQVDG